MDTINAVPTPRFEVGEVLLAAQLLNGATNHVSENHRRGLLYI